MRKSPCGILGFKIEAGYHPDAFDDRLSLAAPWPPDPLDAPGVTLIQHRVIEDQIALGDRHEVSLDVVPDQPRGDPLPAQVAINGVVAEVLTVVREVRQRNVPCVPFYPSCADWRSCNNTVAAALDAVGCVQIDVEQTTVGNLLGRQAFPMGEVGIVGDESLAGRIPVVIVLSGVDHGLSPSTYASVGASP